MKPVELWCRCGGSVAITARPIAFAAAAGNVFRRLHADGDGHEVTGDPEQGRAWALAARRQEALPESGSRWAAANARMQEAVAGETSEGS